VRRTQKEAEGLQKAKMSDERNIADVLEGLAAEALAADPTSKEEIAQIGAALEEAVAAEGDLPVGVPEALAEALEALQGVHEGKFADASAVIDIVATVIAAAAQQPRESDDSEAADVCEAAGRLRSILRATADGTAAAPDEGAASEESDTDEQQPVAEKTEALIEDGAPDTPQCIEDHATHSPDGENHDNSSAASTSGGRQRGAGTDFDPTIQPTEPVDMAPPRLPEDTDADLLGEFAVECLDHISGAEAALLNLESNPNDAEQVNTIFRAFHTIKGTSGFLGLDCIQKLARR